MHEFSPLNNSGETIIMFYCKGNESDDLMHQTRGKGLSFSRIKVSSNLNQENYQTKKL